MWETIVTAASVVGAAQKLYGAVSAILRGRRSDELTDRLAGLSAETATIKAQVERLSDHILYATNVYGVRDVTFTQQRRVDDLRAVRSQLEPFQRALGTSILSSTMIVAPEKTRALLASDPRKVLLNVQPISLLRPQTNDDLVPILFHHEGSPYVGWQMRGVLPVLFDWDYDAHHGVPLLPSNPHAAWNGVWETIWCEPSTYFYRRATYEVMADARRISIRMLSRTPTELGDGSWERDHRNFRFEDGCLCIDDLGGCVHPNHCGWLIRLRLQEDGTIYGIRSYKGDGSVDNLFRWRRM